MLILLSGSSDVGRAAIAEQVIRGHKKWKHIPIETVEQSMGTLGLDPEEGSEFIPHIACECARELLGEGYSIVLSDPDTSSDLGAILREEFGDEFIGIALEEGENDDDFEYVIETGDSSTKDVVLAIEKILEKK